jgi:addiction module RelE/StbE family toxin
VSKYNVVITDPAEKDLLQIAHYISKELKEPGIAQQLITKIAEAVYELEDFPLRYPLVSDEGIALRGVRKMVVDNYIVFYVVSEQRKVVTVIRILFVKRNWKHIL